MISSEIQVTRKAGVFEGWTMMLIMCEGEGAVRGLRSGRVNVGTGCAGVSFSGADQSSAEQNRTEQNRTLSQCTDTIL